MSYEYRDDLETSQNAIEDRIRGWVLGMIGIETIIAFPGAPRPPLPYAVINVTSANRNHEMGPRWYEPVMVGEPSVERMVERIAEDWSWMCSMHVYGPGALDRARVLTNSVRSDGTWVDYLAPLDVRSSSMIRRIPELVDEVWEERANFDLTLSGVVYDGFLIDIIEEGGVTFARKVGTIPALGKDVSLTYVKPTAV